MLFSWYFKGFELLMRYLVKHPTGVDLENLDLEEVDKEMAIDKAIQSLVLEGGVSKNAPADDAHIGDDVAVLLRKFFLFFFFLFGCPLCFTLFCKSNSRTIFYF